eukprot:169724-Prorocentrum_minimum.AAC.1
MNIVQINAHYLDNGLDWTGPDRTGLDWTGLDWTALDLYSVARQVEVSQGAGAGKGLRVRAREAVALRVHRRQPSAIRQRGGEPLQLVVPRLQLRQLLSASGTVGQRSQPAQPVGGFDNEPACLDSGTGGFVRSIRSARRRNIPTRHQSEAL